jgi:hypothetical protein
MTIEATRRRRDLTMGMSATAAPRWVLVIFAAALLTGVGCGGGGGGGTTTPELTCSDGGPAAANSVTLRCGGLTASATERVDVVIGGPTFGSTSLSGLSFDAVYDPSKLEFASLTSATSQLFPANALFDGALANGQPGRVVVSIQQVGGAPDLMVFAGQHVALSLEFRIVAGATFGSTPVQFDPSHSEATDASTAISFSSGLALAHPS